MLKLTTVNILSLSVLIYNRERVRKEGRKEERRKRVQWEKKKKTLRSEEESVLEWRLMKKDTYYFADLAVVVYCGSGYYFLISHFQPHYVVDYSSLQA